jgi:AraC-like DNA-binding protein
VLGWRLEWRPGEIPPQGPAGQPVTAVRRLLAPEPARAWRVASAAAELGVAPRSLQRALTRAGTTFQAELLMVRLDVAAQLIRRTGLPLAEIAATAGFTDHPHLTRRFRERYGCTPSAYRTAPGG